MKDEEVNNTKKRYKNEENVINSIRFRAKVSMRTIYDLFMQAIINLLATIFTIIMTPFVIISKRIFIWWSGSNRKSNE